MPRPTNDLSSLLCEVSTGNLASARARIGELRDASDASGDELVALLVGIARRDGKTFDAILASFPEADRRKLVERCIEELAPEPGAFLHLLADSEYFMALAAGPMRGRAHSAIGHEPGLFLDLLEQGRFAWPDEPFESAIRSCTLGPAAALRFLTLCCSGEVKIDRDEALSHVLQQLDDEGLEKLRAGRSDSRMAELLDGEAKARELFANFDASGNWWEGLNAGRMLPGMKHLIETAGVPDLQWSGVPESLRPALAGVMLDTAVNSQGDPGARVILNSIADSSLPAEQRNKMLAEAASSLFNRQGNIQLAIDFAKRISDDEDGHNAGEDLIIEWIAFDPASPQAYTGKIEPSRYRDRILAKVREITP
ncbi:hypothetical protein [Luteolibacter sp. Populi]|uniref:hypothetical protein n=1 Tax=Luteolibacter sp. Populi TaxID=3230487 RepID=UPI0034667D30